MLGLALAIALGILIAVAVLSWLPEIVEAIGGCLAVLIGLAVILLLLWVFTPALEWLANLIGAGWSRLGLLGPRILFLLLFALWCLLMVGYLVHVIRPALYPSEDKAASGDASAGVGCLSMILGGLVGGAIHLAEGAGDTILTGVGKPLAWRLLLVAPFLVGFLLLVVGAVLGTSNLIAESVWRMFRRRRP